ncbi:MAG: single-stranded DNA-binding protein [Clostridiales bacterium]|nr:single-stranded DNA-binding protein [Clostridiales bacterium]
MNKIILMGRLTKDPELSYTTNTNTAVCKFTLAVNRRFSRPTDEVRADFLPIVTWTKTAEFCSKYFKKGQQVAIVGRVETRNWTDQEGRKHYVTEVIGEEAYFAEGRRADGAELFDNNENVEGKDEAKSQNDGFYAMDEEDDDLPF